MRTIIKVECPYCGWQQNCFVQKTKMCIRCGKTFQIFLKGKSRVVGIVQGSYQSFLKERNIILNKTIK